MDIISNNQNIMFFGLPHCGKTHFVDSLRGGLPLYDDEEKKIKHILYFRTEEEVNYKFIEQNNIFEAEGFKENYWVFKRISPIKSIRYSLSTKFSHSLLINDTMGRHQMAWFNDRENFIYSLKKKELINLLHELCRTGNLNEDSKLSELTTIDRSLNDVITKCWNKTDSLFILIDSFLLKYNPVYSELNTYFLNGFLNVINNNKNIQNIYICLNKFDLIIIDLIKKCRKGNISNLIDLLEKPYGINFYKFYLRSEENPSGYKDLYEIIKRYLSMIATGKNIKVYATSSYGFIVSDTGLELNFNYDLDISKLSDLEGLEEYIWSTIIDSNAWKPVEIVQPFFDMFSSFEKKNLNPIQQKLLLPYPLKSEWAEYKKYIK